MSTQPRAETVGFVGLGTMGGPMAANIIRAGHALVAYDIDKRAVEQMIALGAQAGAGSADVARRASIVVSMVTTTAQAEEVIVGSGGFIDTAQSGDLVICMSTIDPMALPKMRDKLLAKGIAMIDAPVTGMDKGARERTLKAFVGGAAEAFAKAKPVLETMCSAVIHMGDIGSGTAMKLINSMLFQVTRVVATEALVLGAKAGLDPKQLVEVLSGTTANSGALQYAAPRILARDFNGGVQMDITCKDIELQSAFAKSLHVPLFMVNIAQQVYEMARASGFGSEDPAAIVKVYEQYTGVPVVARD